MLIFTGSNRLYLIRTQGFLVLGYTTPLVRNPAISSFLRGPILSTRCLNSPAFCKVELCYFFCPLRAH
nr:MAG TPA: hypothetical protein [Caudoviricetes sp.]